MKRSLTYALCATALLAGPLSGRSFAVQDTARSSRNAESRIEKRIHDDASLKSRDVKVSVSDGIATLTGTVATETERARAGRLARMTGITRVDNNIVVDRAAANTAGTKGTLDKAADKTKEGTAKAVDKTKEGTEKVVDKTKEGVSKGVDKTKEGASVAVDKTKEGTSTALAKTGEGVKKVGSGLADAFVLASVKARLFGEDVLKGSDIHVDCDAHVVTLKGTVPTEAAHARAMELAQKTDGVDRVVDQLTIGPKK